MSTVTISASDLAGRLNLKRLTRSWRGRCPACDYDGNVFSIRESRNGFRPRLYCANGCTPDALEDQLARIVDGWKPEPRSDDDPAKIAERRAAKQAAALRLWAGSETAGHEQYLASRGLESLTSAALRFRGDCHHPEGGRYPAMVALVQDVNGRSIAVHRTYLRRDLAGKAAIEPPKATLGPVWGGVVRLHEIAEELVIGEGIETSASAGALLGLPSWAALNAGNLSRGAMLPHEVRSVVIAADADIEGERAAVAAALRWNAEGRKARIARPNSTGRDFNDLLMARAHG